MSRVAVLLSAGGVVFLGGFCAPAEPVVTMLTFPLLPRHLYTPQSDAMRRGGAFLFYALHEVLRM